MRPRLIQMRLRLKLRFERWLQRKRELLREIAHRPWIIGLPLVLGFLTPRISDYAGFGKPGAYLLIVPMIGISCLAIVWDDLRRESRGRR